MGNGQAYRSLKDLGQLSARGGVGCAPPEQGRVPSSFALIWRPHLLGLTGTRSRGRALSIPAADQFLLALWQGLGFPAQALLGRGKECKISGMSKCSPSARPPSCRPPAWPPARLGSARHSARLCAADIAEGLQSDHTVRLSSSAVPPNVPHAATGGQGQHAPHGAAGVGGLS